MFLDIILMVKKGGEGERGIKLMDLKWKAFFYPLSVYLQTSIYFIKSLKVIVKKHSKQTRGGGGDAFFNPRDLNKFLF